MNSLDEYSIENKFDYYSNPRKGMLEFIPKNCKTLLDVGCGSGAFGSEVKKLIGAEIWGVDPSRSSAKSASSILDKFINNDFSEEILLPKKYFDVITFNDSLEHFPDPFPPLNFCRKLLKTDGVIVCSIPNVRYIENLKHVLFEMDWKYEDKGIRDKTHLRFFTKKSILRTFEEANYKVIEIKGINRRYSWLEGKRSIPIKILLKKYVEDINYMQFAVIAKPNL